MMIRFTLAAALTLGTTAGYAKPVEPAMVTPKGEKIICKRDLETGSLVKAPKKCFTRAQWDRLAESGRGVGQRLTSDHAAGLALSN